MSAREPISSDFDDDQVVVYESSDGRHPDDAIDGSDAFLPESERYTAEERAAPPTIDWPKAERPEGWGSPRRGVRGRSRAA